MTLLDRAVRHSVPKPSVLVLNYPAAQPDSVRLAKAALAGLREALPAEQLEAALERGKGMELDAVVAELLAGARAPS